MAAERIDEQERARAVGGDAIGSRRVEVAGEEVDAGAIAVDDRRAAEVRRADLFNV
jgi:hypothetical protein